MSWSINKENLDLEHYDQTLSSYGETEFQDDYYEAMDMFRRLGRKKFALLYSVIARIDMFGPNVMYNSRIDKVTSYVSQKDMSRSRTFFPEYSNEIRHVCRPLTGSTIGMYQKGKIKKSISTSVMYSPEESAFRCKESYQTYLDLSSQKQKEFSGAKELSLTLEGAPRTYAVDYHVRNTYDNFPIDDATYIEKKSAQERACFPDDNYGVLTMYSRSFNLISRQLTISKDIVFSNLRKERPIFFQSLPRKYETKNMSYYFEERQIFQCSNHFTTLPSANSNATLTSSAIFLDSPNTNYRFMGTKEEKFAKKVDMFFRYMRDYSEVLFFFKFDARKMADYFSYFPSDKVLYYVPVVLHRPYFVISTFKVNRNYRFFSLANITGDLESNLCFTVLRNHSIERGILFEPKSMIDRYPCPDLRRSRLKLFLIRTSYSSPFVPNWVHRTRKDPPEARSVENAQESYIRMVANLGPRGEEPRPTNTREKNPFFFNLHSLKRDQSIMYHYDSFKLTGLIKEFWKKGSEGRTYVSLTPLGYQVYEGLVPFPSMIPTDVAVSSYRKLKPTKPPQHIEGASYTDCSCNSCLRSRNFLISWKSGYPNYNYKRFPHELSEAVLEDDEEQIVSVLENVSYVIGTKSFSEDLLESLRTYSDEQVDLMIRRDRKSVV